MIDASERNGPGKSGRAHQDEDIAESSRSRSNDRDRDRNRGRDRENGRDNRDTNRDNRERGEESDRGRDSSTERSTRYKDDHRLRNDRSDLPSTEATASARMHGHISRGDPNDERYNVYFIIIIIIILTVIIAIYFFSYNIFCIINIIGSL